MSTWAVPATSQSRKFFASSCRATKKPSSVRSVSVWNVSTGTSTSPRMCVAAGVAMTVCGASESAAPKAPPRLCTRKPSKTCAVGWTALMYVTMRNADCDSPMAMTRFTLRSPSGLGPEGWRIAWPACE